MENLMSFVTGDHEKCIQCKACEIACHLAHHDHERTAGNLEVPIIPKLFTKAAAKGAPVQCHQCEDAPCVQACLEKAISIKDRKVVIDIVQCEGCRNYTDCINACPFEAISPTAFFVEGSEVIRGKNAETSTIW